MNTVNDQERYCIVYGGNTIIDGIQPTGEPIFSSLSPRSFYTASEATEFLRTQFLMCMKLNQPGFKVHYMQMYSIKMVKTQYIHMSGDVSQLAVSWYGLMSESMALEEKMAVLRLSVLYGFDISQTNETFIQEVLTSPKYSDIVTRVIPPHMIENIDNFRKVGIATCPKDELGAIMLTSSEDLLQYIGIDRYNISG